MNRKMLKAAVLSISLLMLAATAASPALADISKAFPNADPSTIGLVVSLPSLLMIPTTLLCGKLSSTIRKTRLLYFGVILFIIGGVGPGFSNSLGLILTFRGILGIGLGFIGTLASGFIADFFEGEERAAMMGLQSAMVSIGSIVTTLVAGFLSAINWHYTFFVYFIGLGVLLLTFFKLPEPERVEVRGDEKQSLGFPVYGISALFLFYQLLLFAFFTNIAMVVTSEGLGNAANAGIVLTIMTVGSLVAGIIFGKTSQILKKHTIFAGITLTAAGFLMLSYPLGYNMIIIESFIVGLGFGTTMPAIMIKLSIVAPKSAVTLAIAFANSAMGVGQFISPFVLNTLGSAIGNGTFRFNFLMSGIGILGCAVIWILINSKIEKELNKALN